MAECSNSGSCGKSSCEGCASKEKSNPQNFMAEQNVFSDVKHVIGVVSGKGGVGKSLVTSMLTTAMQVKGNACGILDADITGPSIPKAFGLKGPAMQNEMGLLPAKTKTGIEVMSINLLLDKEDQPVVWRGPVISGVIQQFWSEVFWGDVDYMFVDMPPGTGDVALTVFQSLPVDGIVIVTTPQDLVTMIVKKAVNMANMMNIPILGIVENMSYLECPDCGKKISVFGESKLDEVAKELNIPVLAKLPIRSEIASLVDKGAVELAEIKELYDAADKIKEMLK